MRIARYWAKETRVGTLPQGTTATFTFWGVSTTSQAEAERDAGGRVARWLERNAAGAARAEYEYAIGAIREELVEEIRDADGTPIAALTRNHYGALVLNTARVFIADVDAPEPSALARLFAFLTKPRDKTWHLARIAALQAERPEATYVVYETHSGLRVFRVDRDMEPGSDDAAHELDRLGSDRLYRALCRSQECYRARLTPKPWRCRLPDPPNRFPREGPGQERAFRDWLARYERSAADHAVCRSRVVIGAARPTAAAERLLALHDRMTGVGSRRPLA
jgi:hypothetical protein